MFAHVSDKNKVCVYSIEYACATGYRAFQKCVFRDQTHNFSYYGKLKNWALR